jgi:hypothetical protein
VIRPSWIVGNAAWLLDDVRSQRRQTRLQAAFHIRAMSFGRHGGG